MKIDGKTRLFGIIGNPVSHSLSPGMHNAAFEHLGINGIYVPFPVTDIAGALLGIRSLAIGGVSVTIPHKESVIPHLDRIDAVAEKIGAVNTIRCEEEDGKVLLCGYNTDWIGANRALGKKMELDQAKVIILGAGGSARAIGFGLIEAGAEITLCSRTASRGRNLARDLGCEWRSLEDVASLHGDALINATSVGMSPQHEKSPVPQEVLGGYRVVMDIVYAPPLTTLLRYAEEAGCSIVQGLEMLLYQGVAQFELWTGLAAPVDIMESSLLQAVSSR